MLERHRREGERVVDRPLPTKSSSSWRFPDPAERRAPGGGTVEHDRALERGHRPLESLYDVEPVVVTAAVAVAVDREEHTRLDLCEPIDDAPDAEVR